VKMCLPLILNGLGCHRLPTGQIVVNRFETDCLRAYGWRMMILQEEP
jgi:hypothetical protein